MKLEKVLRESTIMEIRECLVRSLSQADELRLYEGERVLSQILLKHHYDEDECSSPAITITELEDRVEVFRHNLDYNPIRLIASYLDWFVIGEGFLGSLPETIRFGTMPKKAYHNLFEFLEQEGVWGISFLSLANDAPTNELFISKDGRNHAFDLTSVYNLVFLNRSTRNTVSQLIPGYFTPKQRGDVLKFLDMSKRIEHVSRRYAKVNKIY